MSRSKSPNQKSQSQKAPGPILVWSTEMYFTCIALDELEANVLR